MGNAYDGESYEPGNRTAGPKAETSDEAHGNVPSEEPEFAGGVPDGALGEEPEGGLNSVEELSVERHAAENEAAPQATARKSTAKATTSS